MLSREELIRGLTVKELRKYATSIGVKNSHDYKKSELVEAILIAERNTQSSEEAEQEVDNCEGVRKAYESNGKMSYVETATIGMLVAFRVPNTRLIKSAKIINRSVKNRKLKLETAYKKQFIVRYEDVVWVKTGSKWPLGILKALKEGVSYAGENE